MQAGALKGLVIVTGLGPVAEDLADVAVGPLLSFTAVVGAVWRRVGHLRLGGAVLRVVEVEAIADVTEKPGRGLLLGGFLVVAEKKKKKKKRQGAVGRSRGGSGRGRTGPEVDSLLVVVQLAGVVSIQGGGGHFLQFLLQLLVLPLKVNDDRIQKLDLRR